MKGVFERVLVELLRERGFIVEVVKQMRCERPLGGGYAKCDVIMVYHNSFWCLFWGRRYIGRIKVIDGIITVYVKRWFSDNFNVMSVGYNDFDFEFLVFFLNYRFVKGGSFIKSIL